jgi:hypothetical protein
MAKKVERWKAEDGEEFETEAECQDYDEMLAYAPEIIEAISRIPGIHGTIVDAKYIVDSLWEDGYMFVKRGEVKRG